MSCMWYVGIDVAIKWLVKYAITDTSTGTEAILPVNPTR